MSVIKAVALNLPHEMSNGATMSEGYWKLVRPFWEKIDIYRVDSFLSTYHAAPIRSAQLYAAHFCQSEVCNGGSIGVISGERRPDGTTLPQPLPQGKGRKSSLRSPGRDAEGERT
jgi:hypothetical protein